MASDNTDNLANKLCNAVLLTSQSAIVLQQQIQRLPSLFLQLITISECDSIRRNALKVASDWLARTSKKLEETAWQKIYVQQSITDLAEREAQLSSWAVKHHLQHHESLLQLFLEIGLDQDDFNALEKIVCESGTFPELLSFLELMLMTYVLTHQVNLDFQHLLALAKMVAAYSSKLN